MEHFTVVSDNLTVAKFEGVLRVTRISRDKFSFATLDSH